jgi:ABC-type molybdate transport system ATPase subunit
MPVRESGGQLEINPVQQDDGNGARLDIHVSLVSVRVVSLTSISLKNRLETYIYSFKDTYVHRI